MTLPFILHRGDCIEVMRTMADNSVDAIVCDPPYGLSSEPDMAEVLRHWLAGDDYQHKGGGFMGKSWDSFVPGPAVWREAMRVLKPGGHLLAFFGSRTYDMGTLALRLAGFEIRDQIMWVYGSGFPKSLNVAKAIDRSRVEDRGPTLAVGSFLRNAMNRDGVTSNKLAELFGCTPRQIDQWAPRETDKSAIERASIPSWERWLELKSTIGFGDEMDAEVWRLNGRKGKPGDNWTVIGERAASAATGSVYGGFSQRIQINAPTDTASVWDGWGTALKPAHEPIVVARKPLAKGLTVADNVLAHGTGAINIDACRVEPTGESRPREGEASQENRYAEAGGTNFAATPGVRGGDPAGRWPANIIHDGSDEVVALFPESTSGSRAEGVRTGLGSNRTFTTPGKGDGGPAIEASAGSAARFFYCAKASRTDRNEGLASSAAPAVETDATMRDCETADWEKRNGNHHPTVKPTDLMAYLVRLVTPPGGLVLDPFMGSGSTGKACMREGFRFVGIDMAPEYVEIASARIEHELARVTAANAPPPPPPQMDLFADFTGSTYAS